MQSKAGILSLVVAVLSMGVAVYALVENNALRSELEARHVIETSGAEGEFVPPLPADVLERLEAVEADVARVDRVATNRVVPGMPSLEGRGRDVDPETSNDPAAGTDAEPADEEALKAIVDQAVDRKAREMVAMANKKPSLDVFAKTLGLDEKQRQAAEAEVVRGQQELRVLMETPADDGTVFLDEVVELMAVGMVKPGHAKTAWPKLLQRIINERVPGTNTTYGAQAEAVKDTVRASFRRVFRPEQYAKFEQWKMDPTEVQGVEGSAWKDLQERIVNRARELGAKIPEANSDR